MSMIVRDDNDAKEQFEFFWKGLNATERASFRELWEIKYFKTKEADLDQFLFASEKRREKLLESNVAMMETLKFLDITVRDKHRFVHLWRSSFFQEYDLVISAALKKLK